MLAGIRASVFLMCLSFSLAAQQQYVGAAGGIATLSADGRSEIANGTAAISLYKPENGQALNLFGGLHVTNYVSVQANYVWNRNSLALISTRTDPGQTLYEEKRNSDEQSLIGDLLVYFRDRRSRVRPYLSAGLGLVHFRSRMEALSAVGGDPILPPAAFTSNDAALRVAVGIDLEITRGLAFRYSFSETMSHNPVSAELSPPGQRRLANFQNLFGFVKRF